MPVLGDTIQYQVSTALPDLVGLEITATNCYPATTHIHHDTQLSRPLVPIAIPLWIPTVHAPRRPYLASLSSRRPPRGAAGQRTQSCICKKKAINQSINTSTYAYQTQEKKNSTAPRSYSSSDSPSAGHSPQTKSKKETRLTTKSSPGLHPTPRALHTGRPGSGEAPRPRSPLQRPWRTQRTGYPRLLGRCRRQAAGGGG